MLRVDPSQRRRLAEILANLDARIDEATAHGWLGGVEGLQISLQAAKDKMAGLDRIARHKVQFGMPTIPGDRS
ncbi:hypothetical protein [Actinomadura chokoriensis]|uniref:hypothetical protein n=1 Tax=Actinomadura chokoriensis TaxID=454156 RepID=UPI0031FA3963